METEQDEQQQQQHDGHSRSSSAVDDADMLAARSPVLVVHQLLRPKSSSLVKTPVPEPTKETKSVSCREDGCSKAVPRKSDDMRRAHCRHMLQQKDSVEEEEADNDAVVDNSRNDGDQADNGGDGDYNKSSQEVAATAADSGDSGGQRSYNPRRGQWTPAEDGIIRDAMSDAERTSTTAAQVFRALADEVNGKLPHRTQAAICTRWRCDIRPNEVREEDNDRAVSPIDGNGPIARSVGDTVDAHEDICRTKGVGAVERTRCVQTQDDNHADEQGRRGEKRAKLGEAPRKQLLCKVDGCRKRPQHRKEGMCRSHFNEHKASSNAKAVGELQKKDDGTSVCKVKGCRKRSQHRKEGMCCSHFNDHKASSDAKVVGELQNKDEDTIMDRASLSYSGVLYNRSRDRYEASIIHKDKLLPLGEHVLASDAARAYDTCLRMLQGRRNDSTNNLSANFGSVEQYENARKEEIDVVSGEERRRGRDFVAPKLATAQQHRVEIAMNAVARNEASMQDGVVLGSNGQPARTSRSSSRVPFPVSRRANEPVGLAMTPATTKKRDAPIKPEKKGKRQKGCEQDYRKREMCCNFLGVTYNKGIYRAEITKSGKVHCLGVFKYASDAANAYDGEVVRLRGYHWRTNFASLTEYEEAREDEGMGIVWRPSRHFAIRPISPPLAIPPRHPIHAHQGGPYPYPHVAMPGHPVGGQLYAYPIPMLQPPPPPPPPLQTQTLPHPVIPPPPFASPSFPPTSVDTRRCARPYYMPVTPHPACSDRVKLRLSPYETHRKALSYEYKGIRYRKDIDRYGASVAYGRKLHYLGDYILASDAAHICDESSRLLKGAKCELNFNCTAQFERARKAEMTQLKQIELQLKNSRSDGVSSKRKEMLSSLAKNAAVEIPQIIIDIFEKKCRKKPGEDNDGYAPGGVLV